MPEFPGGKSYLQSYLQANLKYPSWENKQQIQGVVYVQFVVDKEGKIRNPEITQSIKNSKNFDEEVLRIISNMPDWIPGIKDGEKVDVIFSQVQIEVTKRKLSHHPEIKFIRESSCLILFKLLWKIRDCCILYESRKILS